MSSFWSGWIIVLTVVNILACVWLIRWTAKPRPGESAEGNVMGHTWDETLQEYNNPLPRWWLWLFYITIVFAFLYLALYPGLGSFKGVFGWTQQAQYEEEIKRAEEKFEPIFKAFAAKPIEALSKDPAAREIGQRLFLTYCAQCHGSTATGARGFPNLTDGDWLYGGDPQAIKTTILGGRMGAMPAMGPALGEEGVEQVTAYVMNLSGRETDAALAAQGKPKFDSLCAACHMPDGSGNTLIGAPRLNDNIWLYGGSAGTIKQTITAGRNGVMPAFKDFLGEDKVHLLAAYVYGLSQ